MNCVPLTSESPSLLARRIGSSPTARSASAPPRSSPVDGRLPLADERQREVRERGEVAARAHGAARRDVREHAAVQALEQQLDRRDARARRTPSRARSRAGASPRARRRPDTARRRRTRGFAGDGAGAPRASSSGMCAETKRPKPVFTPYVCSPWTPSTSSRAARIRALAASRELSRHPVDRDRPHVREGEVLPGQDDRAGHSASLERSTVSSTRDSSTPGSSDAGTAAAAAYDALRDESRRARPPLTATPRARASRRTRSTTSWSGAARRRSRSC